MPERTATQKVYAAIVGMHDRGIDCGALVGSAWAAEEIARAVETEKENSDD